METASARHPSRRVDGRQTFETAALEPFLEDMMGRGRRRGTTSSEAGAARRRIGWMMMVGGHPWVRPLAHRLASPLSVFLSSRRR